MGPLKHLLAGLTCRYFARKPARARTGAQALSARAQERRREHLERCTACRARLQRERQYLERLRGAAVPAASEDLTARLLARTQDLAAWHEDAGTDAASAPAAPPARTQPQRHPGRPLRLAAQIAGGAAATAVLMGGAAYLMGADAALPADEAFTSAFPGKSPTGEALSAEGISMAAWQLSGEPDVTPAGSLSTEQLSALRARGWSCPELRELGYHLVWARGGVAEGSEVLELRLTDGRNFATVLEQHPGAADGYGAAGADRPAPAPGGPAQPAAAQPSGPPVNILTGHPATEDGFVAARLDTATGPAAATAPTVPATPRGALWINKQAPFRAIYRTPTATFTYISELPAEQADDGLGLLVQPTPASVAPAPGEGGIPARLERGLERIVELLAR